MMMLVASLGLGQSVAVLGWALAPASVRPSLFATLRTGSMAALPGAALGLALVDDWVSEISLLSLVISALWAMHAVLSVAFIPSNERSHAFVRSDAPRFSETGAE